MTSIPLLSNPLNTPFEEEEKEERKEELQRDRQRNSKPPRSTVPSTTSPSRVVGQRVPTTATTSPIPAPATSSSKARNPRVSPVMGDSGGTAEGANVPPTMTTGLVKSPSTGVAAGAGNGNSSSRPRAVSNALANAPAPPGVGAGAPAAGAGAPPPPGGGGPPPGGPGGTAPRQGSIASIVSSITGSHKIYTAHCPPERVVRGQNYIRTTKYTLLTFLPLNFYFQFNRFYNIYFLAAALSTIANASSLSPVSQILPLVIVYLFSAAKDAIEDFARYQQDRAANIAPVIAIRGGKRVTLRAQDLQPGDFVYVEKGIKMSVDAVVLSSAIEDGSCFVDTAELDGETNLKRRSAMSEFQHLNHPDIFRNVHGVVECEMPNANLLNFEGKLVLTTPAAPGPVSVPLTMNQLLLKGTVLRNTEYVYAMVLYTGSNTKIIKNLNKSKLKTSLLERQLNRLVLGAFAYNAALLVSSAVLNINIYNTMTSKENARKLLFPNDYDINWYLGHEDSDSGKRILFTVIGYFNIYSYVIPISLFVSMEIVRLLQGQFMRWDARMTCTRTLDNGKEEMVPMRVNNTNLNEDLARVEYIFSDKTGTLTQNDMRMAYWYVDGKAYDEMNDPGCLGRAVQDPATPAATASKIGHYARAIAICHTVLPTVDAKKQDIVYESQSPEETALLNSMRRNGYKLVDRTKKLIRIEVNGVMEEFEQLAVLEFTSARKRMSVIVRTPKGGIQIYTKGADNVILARLSPEARLNDPEMLKQTDDTARELSEQGLRILTVAWSPLTETEFATFKTALDAAEMALVDREGSVERANAMVEQNLQLLGLTAIEDRLQDEVPETIEFLLNCNIRFWLLTGDKQQTAINIGMSSKLITTAMHLMIFHVEGGISPKVTVPRELERLNRELDERAGKQRCALVVGGDMLELLYKHQLHKKFMAVGIRCHSVICSRMTPLQKSLIVKLAQSELNVITLAIGDGANDVSMIQAADVGVGIAGREGTQAVRAADYAFAEFRFLKRLLVVHGRYNFLRMADLILVSFYKNIAFITVQWFFGFVSLWSLQTVYDTIFFTAFNVIYTSLPPFFMGLFEKDVDEVTLEAYAGLYHQVQASQYWNMRWFLTFLLSGVWHATAVFGAVYYVNASGVLSALGRSTGYWVQCYLFSMPILIAILAKFALTTKRWVWQTVFGMLFSISFAIITGPVVEVMNYNLGGIGSEVATSFISYTIAPYYLVCLLVPMIAVLPDLVCIYFKRQFAPQDSDIFEEERFLASGTKAPGQLPTQVDPSLEMVSM